MGELLSRLGTGGGTRDVLVDRTRALRGEGYKTALVTNNFAEVRQAWRQMMPLAELFDVVVDSCEVGMRKPDPAIWQHTLGLLGVDAAQAAFLDDHPANVAAAEQLGMTGVVVTADIAAAVSAVDRLGVG